MSRAVPIAAFVAILLAPDLVWAATATATPALDGATLAWTWALPFLGFLLTVAFAPAVFPNLWQNHYDKFAFAWATLAIVPMAALFDIPTALGVLVRALVPDFVNTIVLLFALYVVGGGIVVTGTLRGTPLVNITFLVLGALIASVVGAIAAVIVLIRPLIRANANRLHNAHVFVFFIVLVANIGGALSPLGAPPLYVGFLRGIGLEWPARHLWSEAALAAGFVLFWFIVIDVWHYRKDRKVSLVGEQEPPVALGLRGSVNVVLIVAIMVLIFVTMNWRSNGAIGFAGITLTLPQIVRDGGLLLIAMISIILTPNEHRESNGFTFGPIRELAILFGALFVAIAPLVLMLRAWNAGSLGGLVALVGSTPSETGYFWVAGILSALINNVPAYLVLFDLAGGDATLLTGPFAGNLVAISLGTVLLGALTYIGSAPGYAAYAIARERGIRMPGFFGYLARAILLLLPVGIAITYADDLRPFVSTIWPPWLSAWFAQLWSALPWN